MKVEMTRTSLQKAAAANAGSTPAYAIESVDSALRVLRMLCQSRELRISEVSERLGVANSTAHRLLTMLVHHGFASQDGRGRAYRAGPAVLEMGFAAIRDMDVRQHARPILEAIRNEVDETVSLVIPYGREVLYVECVESSRQLRIASRVGVFVPAHCIASGKSLLATLTPEEFSALYTEEDIAPCTPRSVTTRTELSRHLERIRRDGLARSRGESDEHVGSIAIAVTDRLGVGRAAISICAPTSRITSEAEVKWVRGAKQGAAALSARLWGQLTIA